MREGVERAAIVGRIRDLRRTKMHYMVEITYPGTKVDDVANSWVEYLNVNPAPEYVQMLDSYAFSGGDGIRALLFYGIDDSSPLEGRDYLAKQVIHFLKSVEGFKGEILVIYPMHEAFLMLDIQPPTAV